jgi:predicted ATPase/DNA-binding SARP family transcriptional activator/class 3 adenylate cyclase
VFRSASQSGREVALPALLRLTAIVRELHSGTVTFLFTDIEGSTGLLKRLGARYADVLEEHHRLFRKVFAEFDGREVDTQGDAVFVAFQRAKDAAAGAVAAQQALAAYAWPAGVDLRVRMGLHTGEPVVGSDRYVGMGVHTAARICSAGHGGQILLSNVTRALVEDELPSGTSLRDLGEHVLKDLDRPERLFQLTVEGLRQEFPALKTTKPSGGTEHRIGLEFRILGPLEAVRSGDNVPLGSRKQRTVLALLLLEAGRVVPSDRLIEELWQGRPPESATVTLRSYISRLRSLLGPEATVIARAGGYVLEGDAGIDARRFERLVREGEDALGRGLARTAAERFRSGLALWRGRALGDVAEDGLLALESGRLDELRLEAVEGRIDAELALGLHSELVGELERLVGEHPLRERFWRQLMLALYRCDRQADALAAYSRARKVLTSELGLEPSEELRRLQQAVLRHEVPDAPRAAEQHNLPTPLSSFVGREGELEEVDRLLSETRLLTVTGVGGVGKTRLALAAAAQAAPRVERVRFVDLSGVRDPGLVPRAVAEALGVPESPHRPLVEILTAHLRATEPLLVLDNCEHVLDACTGLIEQLLEDVPTLHILATSREPLGVAGEVEYALSPLAVPADSLDAERLTRFASVQLFLERASASRADFASAPGAVSTVAQMCRDLDGLPLAIELAAVRAKSLSAEEIAAHLDHRFDFLKFWRRVAVPRHQTLRATMDWSYELLSEAEQRTLCRLSVFVGGFTVAPSARVCTGGDESEMLDLLARLVERSLVVAEPGEAGTRYRLLETVRQYAAERLANAGETEDALRSHAGAFLQLAEEAFSPGRDGMSPLAREQANLRTALEWSFAQEDELALSLTRALGRFWHARWQLVEGRAWLQRAIALHRTEDRLRAELLGMLGGILHDIGDLSAAEAVLANALRIAIAGGDPIAAATIRVRYADVRYSHKTIRIWEALAECETAAAILEEARDLSGLADALAVQGKHRYWRYDSACEETLKRAVAVARESGNRPAELVALQWLAIAASRRPDLTTAIAEQERLLAEVAGEPRAEAGILAPLAWSHGFAGRFAEARDALDRSRAVYAADGMTLEWAACAMNAGSIELIAGDAGAAERALRPAYDALRAMAEAGYITTIAYYLVSSLCEQGRDDEAEEVVDETRSILPPGDEDHKATWSMAAAKVCARRGEFPAAEHLANEARRYFEKYRDPSYFVEALFTQAEVFERAGKHEQAVVVYAEALAWCEERHAVPLNERARTALERLTVRPVPTG